MIVVVTIMFKVCMHVQVMLAYVRIYNIKIKHLVDVEEEYIFLAPCS